MKTDAITFDPAPLLRLTPASWSANVRDSLLDLPSRLTPLVGLLLPVVGLAQRAIANFTYTRFIVCLLILVALRATARIIYNLYFHPLARIPAAHPLAAVTDWWSTYMSVLRPDAFLVIHDLHKQQGFQGMLRVAPNQVVLADPKWTKHILHVKLAKSQGSVNSARNIGPIESMETFVIPDYHRARGQRAAILAHYSATQIPLWQHIFQENMSRLVDGIRTMSQNADAGRGIDIIHLLRRNGIDIGSEVICGHKPGLLQAYVQGTDHPLSEIVRNCFYLSTCRASLPPWLWSLISHWPGQTWQNVVRANARLREYYEPLFLDAIARGKDEIPCTVQRYATSLDTFTGKVWTQDAIVSECGDEIIATSEPSPMGTYSLWLLSTHPSVQQALYDELSVASPDPAVLPSVTELAALPMLNAVMKESMRLYPGGQGPKTRILGDNGLMIGDTFLPPGTAAGVQVWTAHRSEAVWGDDANEFKPDRFLRPLSTEQNLAFHPFSAGYRPCPAQNFAKTTVRAFIASIVRNFVVTPAEGTTEGSMAPRDVGTLMPVSGECRLVFTPRSGASPGEEASSE